MTSSSGSASGAFSASFLPEVKDGWRFSCKEMFDVSGYPATAGNREFAAYREASLGQLGTSRVVSRFISGGAKLVGKTRQSELAICGLGENSFLGTPENPRWPTRWVGGSSSGCAAAVAAGKVDFSVATDTAGSARIPAACCGVVGLTLARSGEWLVDAVKLSPTCDQLGLIAANTRPLRWALSQLGSLPAPAQTDSFAAAGPQLELPSRVVVPWEFIESCCSAETLAAFESALSKLAVHGVTVDSLASTSFFECEAVITEVGNVALHEIAESISDFVASCPAAVSTSVLARLSDYLTCGGRLVRTTDDLARARQETRISLASLVPSSPASLRSDKAPILMPTLPVAPPPISERPSLGRLTKFANLLGESSIAVPSDDRGASLQVVGERLTWLLSIAELLFKEEGSALRGGVSGGRP